MARRMSNRERLERLRSEADIRRAEREAAAAARQQQPAQPRAARKPSTGERSVGRVAVVWLLCDHTGAELQVFPYPQEQAARAAAAKLTAETGKTHFVKRGERPL